MTEQEYRDDVDETMREEEGGIAQWLQDNLRVIISVIIVLLLALGIYSYSQRARDAHVAVTTPATTETPVAEQKADAGKSLMDKISEAMKKNDATAPATTAEHVASTSPETTAPSATQDTETDNAFVSVAQRGDGRTHLARRALAQYVATQHVEGLTGAHKVFIEDYLQKAVGGSSVVRVGQDVAFSKDLIKQAIEKAQHLTPAQLQNLQQYATAASLS